MNRPKYESVDNRAAEKEIIASVKPILLARGWGEIKKDPTEYAPIDCYSGHSGKVLGAFEIKDRPAIDFKSGWPIFLNTFKANSLIRRDQSNCPAFFIIRDKHKNIRWASITLQGVLSYSMKWCCRTDRGDNSDMELVFMIPDKYWNTIDSFPKR